MTDRRVGGLIALNLGLLGVLGLVSLGPSASAQPTAGSAASGQPTRARGDYTMVAGAIRAGNASAIWLLDKANQEMVVVRWDEGRKNLDGVGYRSLIDDAKAPPSR